MRFSARPFAQRLRLGPHRVRLQGIPVYVGQQHAFREVKRPYGDHGSVLSGRVRT